MIPGLHERSNSDQSGRDHVILRTDGLMDGLMSVHKCCGVAKYVFLSIRTIKPRGHGFRLLVRHTPSKQPVNSSSGHALQEPHRHHDHHRPDGADRTQDMWRMSPLAVPPSLSEEGVCQRRRNLPRLQTNSRRQADEAEATVSSGQTGAGGRFGTCAATEQLWVLRLR